VREKVVQELPQSLARGFLHDGKTANSDCEDKRQYCGIKDVRGSARSITDLRLARLSNQSHGRVVEADKAEAW
jgi:hypothetical protein